MAKNYRSVILAAKRPKVGLHGSLVLALLLLFWSFAFARSHSKLPALVLMNN